jgi:hypothetical protein
MIPPPLDQLGRNAFSFYPPIVNIEHNGWVIRRANWTEVQVMNTKTAAEIWIPRHFIGEVSLVGEPVMIVGLIKELECREGVVYPHVRRVIEMPRAVNDGPRPRIRPPSPDRPASVVGIRLETGASRKRTILGAMAAGLLACVGCAIVLRDGGFGTRFAHAAPLQINLPFTAKDNYESVVRKFGPPAHERYLDDRVTRLSYPERSVALFLKEDRYIGARGRDGRILQSVDEESAALLAQLR